MLSKPLINYDQSGFEFTKEMLAGHPTAGVNFDRIQYDPQTQKYIIFELLLCEERQHVTPWTSHPRRYWNQNKQKFIKLYTLSKKLDATLYLVNYAKKGTAHENEILVIQVLEMDDTGITKEKTWEVTRIEFQKWFVALNDRCLG